MEKQIARILELIEEETFSSIDLYFAKALLKGSSLKEDPSIVFLLCYLLAAARHGHLCLHILPEGLLPSPYFLTSNHERKEEIEKKVLLGALHLSEALCQDVGNSKILTPLCRYENLIYLQKSWLLETHFLSHLKRIQSGSLRLEVDTSVPTNPLLNEKQRKAVLLALTSPLCFISGGPGTGKTFTAAEIVKTFLAALSEEKRKTVLIKIAAPTGKAASHLEKKVAADLDPSVHVECGTLHSLLGIKFKESRYQVSLFADLFIIDEASMLDAKLFSKLLASLQEGGRLVFMGDKNQLPPVESGALFADLIDSAKVISASSILLEECLRVEKKQMIDFAEKIIEGDLERVLTSSYVRQYSPPDIHQIKELIWEKCQLYFSSGAEESTQFRVLSCIRKGPLGVEDLNEMVLQRFLEGKREESFFSVPILITENSESMQLMNGDVGYLIAKVSSFKTKRFDAGDKAYFASRSFSALLLPAFEWGYCLSVHKSQGSEYDSVIAIAPKGSEGFGREVLYTAVTRAKKEILLMGEESTLIALVSKSSRKVSGLTQRLKTLSLEESLRK